MTTQTLAIPHHGFGDGWLRRLGRDWIYLLTGLPVGIVSFVVLLTGLSLGAGLLITLVGVPVLAATLLAARGFAEVERVRLRWVLARPVRSPGYRRLTGSGVSGWLRGLADPQSWLDLLHGLLLFPVSLVTWVLAALWWPATFYGIFWPLFGHALDAAGGPASQDLPQAMGVDSYAGRSAVYVALGVLFGMTLPFVMRGLAAVQSAMGRTLLANAGIAALQARVDTLTASRSAAAEAEAAALRRLERDLHDGPQQRLVRLAMDLGTIRRRLETDPESAKPMVSEALEQTRGVIAELRALSRGIAPPVLADRGLGAALTAVAALATVRVDLDVRLADGERLPAAIENAAYFIVTEALTNVAKHASATSCRVVVAHENGELLVQVEDDGVGGAHLAKGHGLAGLADRAAGVDGTLTVTSPPGGPTRVVGRLPCG